jgi:hypothetical protein
MFFVTPQWGCTYYMEDFNHLYTFFYLLACPRYAGHYGGSLQGVPDVHNFFIFRKLGNLEFFLDGGSP